MMQDTNARDDLRSFARLVDVLAPWLDQVVIVGGWAHRLYRLHSLAQPLEYEPLATFDTDVPCRISCRSTAKALERVWQQVGSRKNCLAICVHLPFTTGL